jgi:hypothetical protein
MSHDPRTKKCRKCGRAIAGGAFCFACRRDRRAKGIGRRRASSRATKRSGNSYASYAGITCSSGSTPVASDAGIVATGISAPAREEGEL